MAYSQLYFSDVFWPSFSKKGVAQGRESLPTARRRFESDFLVVCDDCQGYLNPALAADAAVRRGDTILLVQRKYPPNPGSWVLPGGFVDRDEDPEHAVVRELKEEAGLDGKQPKLLMVMGDPKKHGEEARSQHCLPVRSSRISSSRGR